MSRYEQLSMFTMNVDPVTLLGIRWFCGPCPADRPTSSVGMNTTTT